MTVCFHYGSCPEQVDDTRLDAFYCRGFSTEGIPCLGSQSLELADEAFVQTQTLLSHLGTVEVVPGLFQYLGSLDLPAPCASCDSESPTGLQPHETRGPKSHINIRILQGMVSGIPCVWGRRMRSQDPYPYVVSRGPYRPRDPEP